MKIPIKGVIVANEDKWIYEWFGYEVTTPDDVDNLIKQANGEKLEVIINSPGGDVYSGSEIYTSLMDYKGPATSKIVGIAASAASVIAMAGDPAKISPTAQIMLHNVSEIAQGDYRTFEREAEVLKNYNKSIANAYILKTGMKMDDLLELMNSGGTANTGAWLNAQQAKEYGFVDEIMFDTGNKLAASAAFGNNMLLPQNVVDKVREALVSESKEDIGQVIKGLKVNVGNDGKGKKLEIAKAKLRLLKIKGMKI